MLGGTFLCSSFPPSRASPHFFIYTCVLSPLLCELVLQLAHLTDGETEARDSYRRRSSSISKT